MVGVRRFELPAPASRRQCSTRLSYTPSYRRAPYIMGAAARSGLYRWLALGASRALALGLIGPLNAEIDDVDQHGFDRAIWENAEGIAGHISVVLSAMN